MTSMCAYRELTSVMAETAARYRDQTAVLGYDLMNEPIRPIGRRLSQSPA